MNIRRLDKWLISRFKHGLRKPQKPNWAYPCTNDKCRDWIYQRELFHLEILEYFSDCPDKIIIVNIDKPGWEKYIASQLEFKKKSSPSNVHSTNNSKEHQHIVNTVTSTLNELNYDRQTILFPNQDLLNKYLSIYRNYV